MGQRGEALMAGATAVKQRAVDWWNSLSDDEKDFWRSRGVDSASAWAMDRRCRKGRPRATDICNGDVGTNGTGNGHGNGGGTMFLFMTPQERAEARAIRAEERRAARQVSGPGITMPRLTPGQFAMTGGTGANGNGAQLWYQNPLVWLGGGLAVYYFWMRK